MPLSSELHAAAPLPARAGRDLRAAFRPGALPALLLSCALLVLPAALRAQRIAPAVKDSATVVYDEDGLRIHSADGRRQLKIKGYVAFDAKAVLSDTSDVSSNGFALRRSRLTFDANVNKWVAFRVSFDLVNQGATFLTDGFADVNVNEHWWMRIGKQKTPGGPERGTTISEQFLAERSIASGLGAGRDAGMTITGEYGHGRYEATLGLFNGLPDGVTGDIDLNDAKDGTLRVTWRPLLKPGAQGITLGGFGVTGIEQGTAANSQLPKYSSLSGQTFFSYNESGGALASGRRTREGLFSTVHLGQWGANAEWYSNVQAVRRGAKLVNVPVGGFLGVVDYVLTGERSVQGGVVPARPFDPEHGRWGAFQVAARVAQVEIGDAAFPLFADPAHSARQATEWSIGLSWFITRTTRLQLNGAETAFSGGAAGGGDRKTEQELLARMQVLF